MIHDCERLALELEALEHLRAVHAESDDLQRDAAAHWLLLLGEVDRAHTAVTELLEDPVRTDLFEAFVQLRLVPGIAVCVVHRHEMRNFPSPDAEGYTVLSGNSIVLS